MKNVKTIVLATIFLATALPAMAEVVVVVNPNSTAATMTNDQVADVFLGKSTSLTPINQSESAPIRNEFYKKVTDKEAAQAKAHWAKLLFTGKATMPKEVGNSADVKKAVAADPKAIGYIEKSAVDSSVKTVLTAP
jgi:ABC-type phosphate transport system substrate-binding protein